jgi:hypothetical protein
MKAEIGKRYRHYKGNEYIVLGIARHSETLEEMVVYEAQYITEFGPRSLWVRPRAMFEEFILMDGKEVERFTQI